MIHVLLGSADFDDRIPDRENCIFWQDDLNFGLVPSTETLDDQFFELILEAGQSRALRGQ
jgi:hypothetical protein